ncbi:helix-turn-helix transcriptional regulator [Kitasatospora sp. MAP5-34]|uniref:ArsR/SmtB family transcription factor n=1 Tax=Kitasatospora sp. MAP5-34 TaxID=3035102 RepID=UPI002475EBC9|nr:helix-turn-helix transcriptional regulator [Kitasatospora sp. MAP5-34]MDH6578238.1 DNA-binding transcriptional ArsR family regulator [Kitasatospora sp. MAP5-34]
MTESRSDAEPDVAHVARIFADGTRARILTALAGGGSLAAGTLADEAGVSRQAASTQLAALTAAGMITVEQSGRHRYYRLGSPQIAEILESLAGLAPGLSMPNTLRASTRAAALRRGRVCYDHIAGRLGTAITDALVERDALTPATNTISPTSDHPYRLGSAATAVFTELGLSETQLADQQHEPLLRFCLDWSEKRPHLAGHLGAELLTTFTQAHWVTHSPKSRVLRLTALGEQELSRRLDIRTGIE